jgi:hypothetical protein
MTDIAANVLNDLKGSILPILKDSLKDILDTTKAEVVSLLDDITVQMAKQTFLSVNGTDEEKAQVPENMAALKAQVIVEGCDAVIVDTAKALAIFAKVVETVGTTLIKYAPKILAMTAAAI